jgi:LysM repeat protein
MIHVKGEGFMSVGRVGAKKGAAFKSAKAKGGLASRKPDAQKKPAPRPGHDHTVKEGETLSSIAKTAYGDANRWRDLQDANPHVRTGSLQVGQTLKIPADQGLDRVAQKNPEVEKNRADALGKNPRENLAVAFRELFYNPNDGPKLKKGIDAGAGASPQGTEESPHAGLVDRLGETAQNLADKVVDAAERLVPISLEGVREGAKGLPDAKEIAGLKDGDKITVGGDASVSGGRGGKVGVDGTKKTTIEKRGDKYVVTTRHAANLLLKGSRKGIGGTAKGGGEATVTYEAKTPEEAAKIARLVNQARMHNPTPGIKDAHTAQNAKDLEFLSKHVRSMELSGASAVALGKSLGVKDPGGESVNLAKLGGKASSGQSVKITFDDQGRPDTITWKGKHSGEMNGGPGLSLKKDGQGGSTKVPGGKTKVTLERSTTWKIPRGVTREELIRDPVGTLQRRAGEMAATREDETKLKIDVQSGKDEHRVTVVIDEEQADLGGLVDSVRRGDLTDLARTAGIDKVTYESWKKVGLDTGIGIDVGVADGSINVERTTRRRQNKVVLLDTGPQLLAGGAMGA